MRRLFSDLGARSWCSTMCPMQMSEISVEVFEVMFNPYTTY